MTAATVGPAARIVRNPARSGRVRPEPAGECRAWHRERPGFSATPLHEAPGLAHRLGLDRLWLKDETVRLGLPAFKILGASWAARTALARHGDPARAVLVAATDGNHGHAVARVAADQGHAARVFVPAGTAPARVAVLQAEGATVDVDSPTYDDAVAAAAAFAAGTADAVLVSDTAYEADDPVALAVVEGYGTLVAEVREQLGRAGGWPDLVCVQIGSGGLAAAAARLFAGPVAAGRTVLVGVEPEDAACALASVGHEEPQQIRSTFGSVMVGLNVGRLSAAAWPDVAAGFDAFAAVADGWCRTAQRLLAGAGVRAGETGAAGLAGLLAVRDAAGRSHDRDLAPIREARTALVVVTEGPTGA